jgi:hypothetical protein
MNKLLITFTALILTTSVFAQSQLKAGSARGSAALPGKELPAVPTIPEVDSPKPNGTVPLGDIRRLCRPEHPYEARRQH